MIRRFHSSIYQCKLPYSRGRARLLWECVAKTDANLDITGLIQNTFNQYEKMTRVAEEQRQVVFLEPDVVPTSLGLEQPPPLGTEDGGEDINLPANGEAHHILAAQRILEENSNTLLFAGSRLSSLSATMILLQCCRTHKCTSAFITELLTIIRSAILPEINTLPASEYAATKPMQKLGLEHVDIDVCPNGCMLYCRGDQQRDTCSKPNSGAPRFKRVGASHVPHKVLRFFPIIPRLQRLYSTSKLASLLTWHSANKSVDGKMRHAADSRQW